MATIQIENPRNAKAGAWSGDIGSPGLGKGITKNIAMVMADSHSLPELDFRKANTQNAILRGPWSQGLRASSMKTIGTYSMQYEADLARIALEAADIPAVVLGVGVGMRGGMGGVQLLVPEDCIEAALKVLKELEEQDERPG